MSSCSEKQQNYFRSKVTPALIVILKTWNGVASSLSGYGHRLFWSSLNLCFLKILLSFIKKNTNDSQWVLPKNLAWENSRTVLMRSLHDFSVRSRTFALIAEMAINLYSLKVEFGKFVMDEAVVGNYREVSHFLFQRELFLKKNQSYFCIALSIFLPSIVLPFWAEVEALTWIWL